DPELVENIREAGNDLGIDWHSNMFAEAISLLLNKYNAKEIEERLYDEDNELIDFISTVINTHNDDSINTKEIVRLYLPVLLVILFEIS
ncbi:MAG: hypothetical protein OEY49_11730, partial [Candidatus Heimdallarchaeota archaeon]|nr:hypothetical protein [Candidatus Heimdallarchaeota archaeon]